MQKTIIKGQSSLDIYRQNNKELRKKENFRSKNGITLIALVITIIVLLILAGVSIAMLTGENGILTQANKAKTQSELAEEREKVELAVVAAKAASQGGEIKEEDLKKELDSNLGSGKYQIQEGQNEAGEEGWIVTGESGTGYFVSKDGKVEEQTPPEPVEIPEGLGIGSKVTYTPPYTEEKEGEYNWQAEYCSSTKAIGTDDVMLKNVDANYKLTNWRVYSIDEITGEVELVPTAPTSGTVYLGQAQGYNNAVKLLNDACSSLYSDSGKGITARSMNIEDIEKKMTEEGLKSAHETRYGNQVTSSYSKSNSWFPTIYEQEKYRAIDKEVNTREETGLNLSEQEKLIGRTASGATDGRKQAETSIQPTQTYWYKNYGEIKTALRTENGINYSELIMPQGTATKTYWLASRCIYAYSSNCNFVVGTVSSGGVYAYEIYGSDYNTYNFSHAMFPVVSLSSELLETDGAGGFIVK